MGSLLFAARECISKLKAVSCHVSLASDEKETLSAC